MTNRVYDFNLAASLNATQRFDVAGAFVKVLSAPGGRVGVRVDGGAEIALYEGQGWRAEPGKEFRDVQVRNMQAVANAGELFIGDSRFEDSRVTGVVAVVDGGRARTLAGQAGIANAVAAATPGLYSFGQLWNPPGSAKRVVVKRMTLGLFVAGEIYVRTHNAALANMQGTPVSKLDQGLLAGIEIRDGTNAVAALGQALLRLFGPASSSVAVDLSEPLVLNPGFGVMACCGSAVNMACLSSFEFTTEPV